MYREKYISCQEFFFRRWNGNLISAFKHLLESEKVEIITSGATHAYFPLWEIYPQIVELQIEIGIQEYQCNFGRKPRGFWLPECGFYPGVDSLLRRSGIIYSFIDSHGILNGHPRPRFGVAAPVHTPEGLACFGRDWASHDKVWLKDRGYPGDPFYLEPGSDIGFHLDSDYLQPFTHSDARVPTGIKYNRAGSTDDKSAYDPDIAFSRCDDL
jgi:1,4-alpha-glucan branching enzyme